MPFYQLDDDAQSVVVANVWCDKSKVAYSPEERDGMIDRNRPRDAMRDRSRI